MNARAAAVCSLVVLLLPALVGCPQPSKQVYVWGRADLDAPLSGATVTLRKVDSESILWEGVAVEGDFADHLPAEEFAVTGADLVLTASGGLSNGAPFTGTLKAYVPAFDGTGHLEISILSTLIAEYMTLWEVSYEQARQDVFDYMEIPRDYTLLDRVHQDGADAYFDAALFLEEAETYGGFDAYVLYLVETEIGTGSSEDFSALTEASEDEAWRKSGISDMLGSLASWAIGQATDAAGGWMGEQAIGWALSLFGFDDSDDGRFDAIDQKLEEVNGKLDLVLDGLGSISEQLDGLLEAVGVHRDEIIEQVAAYHMADAQTEINTQYSFLSAQFEANAADAHTAEGRARALAFANAVQNTSRIEFQLARIHDCMVGANVGTVGFLDACTNVLIDRAQTGEADLYDCYEVLETYFSELLAVQAKGMILTLEALHIQEGGISTDGKAFLGTPEQFAEWFRGNIEAQVKVYMSCVDRLVLSQCDVRTALGNAPQFLPDNAGAVYERADFYVAQLTDSQPTGFTIRLVGTPREVRAALDAGVYLQQAVLRADCAGLKGGAASAGIAAPEAKFDMYYYAGTSNTTTTRTAFIPVPVNGKTVNLYAAPRLSYASSKGYLDWSSGSTFRLESNLAVAKLVLGTVATTSTTSGSLVCDLLSLPVFDESWSLEPDLMAPLHGTTDRVLQRYDERFNLDPAGTPYASRVVGLRRLPAAWSTTQTLTQTKGRHRVDLIFDPQSMKVATFMTVYDFYDEVHLTSYFYRRDDYLCDVSALTQELLELRPATEKDACAMGLKASAKVGAAYSYGASPSNGATTAVKVGIGTQWTPEVSCTGAHSDSPLDLVPVTPTGPQALTVQVPAGTGTNLVLSQNTRGWAFYWNQRPPSTVTVDGTVKYSELEIYPAK